NKAAADRVATEIGEALIAIRDKVQAPLLSPDEAIDAALSTPGLVVIADTSDNAGGGAPSDNTTFIHRLMARGVAHCAVAPIFDPVAVELAFDAGEGARLPFRFGGKIAATSGIPVDSEVEIVATKRQGSQTFAGSPVPLGDVATLRTPEGVSIVLISTRCQAMGPDLFASHGVDIAAQKILIVKSNQHFHAGFAPVASRIIYAAADGPLKNDPRQFTYRHIQRPIWPLDNVVMGGLIL
ncbi:MAG: MlrC C-terminal domain-containing protein, partial [Beijerinckiaceae bacterium]